jgi:hypothetical protein
MYDTEKPFEYQRNALGDLAEQPVIRYFFAQGIPPPASTRH